MFSHFGRVATLFSAAGHSWILLPPWLRAQTVGTLIVWDLGNPGRVAVQHVGVRLFVLSVGRSEPYGQCLLFLLQSHILQSRFHFGSHQQYHHHDHDHHDMITIIIFLNIYIIVVMTII